MEKLGIDPLLLIVQIVNFALLFIILKKVLYKPILRALKAREEKLAAIDKDAKELIQKKESFEIEREKSQKAAKLQVKRMLDEAILEAGRLKKQALEEGNKRVKDLIAKGQNEIERQRRLISQEITLEAKELSKDVINKVLSQVLDKSARTRSVTLAARELESKAKIGKKGKL
ncbi:hypothetical protein A2961_01420 [Candidatus Woesebacteria bacterium RIFCSPLOWO2_01_FULL_39_21]|uniref:ATP synthase subunit b n=1 Tax=Candidatus Woesebacteria bacterium RIFCSPLOWO2_01_FULL_39_21 TaxID=1802519 RepID=A0A1F8BKZ2_9BACT|nr:MAG: hypothetical protein A2961_01420 [Candidatus Woesebacteria bacterium RIFCSPLOWO2_01_FULL_39_21]